MTTKEEKPQLAGVRLKIRKRNIVVAHDPQSFSDAIVDVLADAAEDAGAGAPLDRTLDLAAATLGAAELDFSRYGDVLFEVGFAGARLASGGALAAEAKKVSPLAILSAPAADRPSIEPYVAWFQALVRRRPFLVKHLESTLIKLLLSLEFFDAGGRARLAVALARVFARRVGVLPERVLPTLLEDRLVARGSVAAFVTEFFADFLATEPVEALVELLRKGRLEGRLLELFPQHKRSWEHFEAHFSAAGLGAFVDYQKAKLHDAHAAELRAEVGAALAPDAEGGPPPAPAALAARVRARADEWGLAPEDAARALFLGVLDSVLAASAGRNTQQVQMQTLRAVKAYARALAPFCTSARVEIALLNAVQVACYEDSRLLKVFADAAKLLYDADVLGEDTVRHWYARGSHPKGRNVFLKDMEPFIKWLDEAEEEEDDE